MKKLSVIIVSLMNLQGFTQSITLNPSNSNYPNYTKVNGGFYGDFTTTRASAQLVFGINTPINSITNPNPVGSINTDVSNFSIVTSFNKNLVFKTNSEGSAETRMHIGADGNIGIGGTTSPRYPLVFTNGLGDKISFFDGSTSNTTNHYGIGIQPSTLQIFTGQSSHNIAFGYGRSGNFTEKMRIQGNGYVGIGSTNPKSSLHIIHPYTDFEPYGLTIESTNNSTTSNLRFTSSETINSPANFWSIWTTMGTTPNPGPTSFFDIKHGSNSVLTASGFGNVGIGTSTPYSQTILHLRTTEGYYNELGPQLLIENNSSPEKAATIGLTGGNRDTWEIQGHGSSSLNNANITFSYHQDVGSATYPLVLMANGNATFAGALYQYSDKTLKNQLIPLIGSLSHIAQLNGYHYHWKDEKHSKSLQTGIIAQEVEKIFPELVEKDRKGFLSVNYTGLIPHLIEAVKELKEQNEVLSRQNKEFKATLESLQSLRAEVVELKSSLANPSSASTKK